MIKRCSKILFTILITFIFASNVFAATSGKTSLKDLKDQLAKDKANVNAIAAKQQQVQKNIKNIEKELDEVANEIDQCESDIKTSKEKVIELETEITNKQLEIDNLLNFLQVSKGENVYMEYIFKAKSFTDFIYRSAVVEQLTEHNDNMINEMYDLIEKNKQEQKNLSKKIDDSENTIDKLNVTLKKYNLTMDDLVDDHKDAKADYLADKKEVEAYEKLYKQNGCKETTTILNCIDIPYANGFIRPLKSGTITSEYGLRYHPTLHYYRMHNGIDIGTPMNTPVYAAAAGIVTKITRVANPAKKNSSCGGNKVYVKHRVNGKEYTTAYMHLHSISVKLNDFVTASTVIGKSGGGESYDYCTTGPHLHFGILKGSTYENPRNYVNFPKLGKRFTSRY
jgi:murein DD-endopeptidase MepM/ murein hydrolase activator NlpD